MTFPIIFGIIAIIIIIYRRQRRNQD